MVNYLQYLSYREFFPLLVQGWYELEVKVHNEGVEIYKFPTNNFCLYPRINDSQHNGVNNYKCHQLIVINELQKTTLPTSH